MKKVFWFVEFNWTIDEIKSNEILFWDKIFVKWTTEHKSSWAVLKDIKTRINWALLNYDISISSEDKLEIFRNQDKNIETIEVTWEDTDFNKIYLLFKDIKDIACIREWEDSEKYQNKVIKIDLYK
jgi:hypothetical protein